MANMTRSPTATNKRGTKVHCDGYTFDSKKEAFFYTEFIKKSGVTFDVHPAFILEKGGRIDRVNVRNVIYTPDFVTYDDGGQMTHVYDVKNSFGVYGIDPVVSLRFKMFLLRYKIPVEAVVVRTHDFKVIAQGIDRRRQPTAALVRTSIDYDWIRATNYKEAYKG